MFLSLDVLRARKGDCLMLHFGSKTDPHLMLIDGGPSDVYKPQLKPRLLKVRAARNLETSDALPVDVVMVSHIDDDHIKGILELSKEQRDNNPALRLRVKSLWFNSFDDLLTTKPDELTAGFGTASILAGVDPGSAFNNVELEGDKKEDGHQAVEVLASIPQGRQLRDDAAALHWAPNDKFKGKLILVTATSAPVQFDGGLKVTAAGPMQQELLDLQKDHDQWVKDHQAGIKKSPEALLAAFVDTSVPNLSSIVVLAELGGKSVLLTGDARGDKILKGLELAKILDQGGTRKIDILKVPHHGSDNNMETIFFKRLPAAHYVFSGNGENGNPERNTMAMLLEARGTEADYTIHLTYPVAEIDVARKADWETEQGKEKARKAKNPAGKTVVRDDWSPAKNGLVAFFSDNPKFAKKVVIVDEAKPHLIDLLDPLTL